MLVGSGIAPAAGEQTYTDRRYGYSIRYPLEYVLEAPGTGGYFTLFQEGRRVISGGVESLEEAGKKELGPSPDVWKDFILKRAQVSCDADGPDGSVYCPGIARQRTWRTASGLRVVELYLRQIEERFGPPLRRRLSTVGPIYAVDISRPGYVFGLLVGSGHDFPRTLLDRRLVRKIVNGVRLLPESEFQQPQPSKVGPGPLFERVPGKAVIPMPGR